MNEPLFIWRTDATGDAEIGRDAGWKDRRAGRHGLITSETAHPCLTLRDPMRFYRHAPRWPTTTSSRIDRPGRSRPLLRIVLVRSCAYLGIAFATSCKNDVLVVTTSAGSADRRKRLKAWVCASSNGGSVMDAVSLQGVVNHWRQHLR
jgi:hypothetical protein